MLIGGLGAHTVKMFLLVFLALIALAPILRTPTASTSADWIMALTTALFLVHLALVDYSFYTLRPRSDANGARPFFSLADKTHWVRKD
jgi:Phosphatidylinositol N-acetylglucosaminyltransferase